jgi:maltose/moltooligosaccharide transporter
VLWTIVSTREHPPADLEAFRRERAERAGFVAGCRDILGCVRAMPATMRRLAWVQACTWFGLFCMWLFFPVAVARNVLGAPDESSPLYTEGVEWGGLCFAAYSAVCFAFSIVLPRLAVRLGRRATHTACLLCGAAGLVSVAFIHDKNLLLVSMAGVGVAWASILSMPYAMLAGALPPGRTGVYMGIFNFFIVLPEIAASLGFGWVMQHLLNNNRLSAVVAGGVFMVIAAGLTQLVDDEPGRA